MSYRSVPLDAIVTNCLPNCKSRIRWEYDAGERTTRDYPGYPESVTPYDGCSEDHLEQVNENFSYLGMAWDQWYYWTELQEAAEWFKIQSRVYLGLTPHPITRELQNNRENRERAEQHAQTGR